MESEIGWVKIVESGNWGLLIHPPPPHECKTQTGDIYIHTFQSVTMQETFLLSNLDYGLHCTKVSKFILLFSIYVMKHTHLLIP